MRALDILDQVESVSSKNEKVAILSDFKNDPELKDLLDAALNFSRKFHIKKFDEELGFLTSHPQWTRQSPIHRINTSHECFMWLLEQLEARVVTGHDAQMLCNSHFHIFDENEQEAKWYRRILFKDLKAGFDISTANKAGFDIPKFDVMLAKDGKHCKKLPEIVQGGVYVSPKLDGYRCIAICNNGAVTLHSRNGTEYENFPSIVESLESMCADSRFILDGEIMSNDFNAMQQTAFASKRGTAVGDVKYHVFGWVSWDEWMSDKFTTPTYQRLMNLYALWESTQANQVVNLELVDQRLCYQVETILSLEQSFLSQGYEGAMVLPNIPYFRGRKSNKLMKFKTMNSQDCLVTGIYEGKDKYEGLLGGMHVLQEDGATECDVGSGFSDEDRAYIWNNPESVIGRTAEIKYQDITPKGKMRFPIFLRWRDDK